jgi:hypothetical protein
VTIEDVARWIIRSQPYLPGLLWFFAVLYGCFAALFALGAWWPGVAVCVTAGAVSWWCVRRIQAGARELARIVAEHDRAAGEDR